MVMKIPLRPVVIGMALVPPLLLLADVGVGSYASGRVADEIGCRLDSTEVDVHVPGWPRSRLVLGSTVGDVEVRAHDVSISGLKVDLDLTLDRVRRGDAGLDETSANGTVTVSIDQLAAHVVPVKDELVLDSGDGFVTVALEGGVMPASVTLEPAIADGRLVMSPTGITLGGRDLSGEVADDLLLRLLTRRAGPELGRVLDDGIDLPLPDSVVVQDVSADPGALAFDVRIERGGIGGLARDAGDSCG